MSSKEVFEVGDTVKAIKDHKGKAKDDLAIKKGAFFSVLSVDSAKSKLFLSQSDQTDKRGWVPMNHVTKTIEESSPSSTTKSSGGFFSFVLKKKNSNSSQLITSDPRKSLDRTSIESPSPPEGPESPINTPMRSSIEEPVSRPPARRRPTFSWKGREKAVFKRNLIDADDMEDKLAERPSREALIQKGVLKPDDENQSLMKRLLNRSQKLFTVSGGWEQRREGEVPFSPSNALFGKPLISLVQRDKEFVIPTIMADILKEILRSGIKDEGIFRLSGGTSDIVKLKEAFVKGETPDLKNLQRHTLTSVFKQWLRELPEPLCTFSLYSKFMGSINIPKLFPKVSTLASAIKLLPSENLLVFAYLIVFLGEVSMHSLRNKMDGSNLGVVFGPTLLSCSEKDPAFDPFEQMRAGEPITLAIEARQTLFPGFVLDKLVYSSEDIEKLRDIKVPEDVKLADPPVKPASKPESITDLKLKPALKSSSDLLKVAAKPELKKVDQRPPIPQGNSSSFFFAAKTDPQRSNSRSLIGARRMSEASASDLPAPLNASSDKLFSPLASFEQIPLEQNLPPPISPLASIEQILPFPIPSIDSVPVEPIVSLTSSSDKPLSPPASVEQIPTLSTQRSISPVSSERSTSPINSDRPISPVNSDRPISPINSESGTQKSFYIEVDSSNPLPEGWRMAKTPEGRLYFVDKINGKTSWKDPRNKL